MWEQFVVLKHGVIDSWCNNDNNNNSIYEFWIISAEPSFTGQCSSIIIITIVIVIIIIVTIIIIYCYY